MVKSDRLLLVISWGRMKEFKHAIFEIDGINANGSLFAC
jgi:hypothetical protein